MHPFHKLFSKQQQLNRRPIRHPGHVSQAREPRRVEVVHEVGHPRRCTPLSCRVEGAIQAFRPCR
eukprot:145573-Chlamydomonas_euryale.AAC.10